LKRALHILIVIVIANLLLSAQDTVKPQPGVSLVFTTIDPPHSTSTIAERINRNGVIVGYAIIDDVVIGFEFDGTTYTVILYPGAASTYLFGINLCKEIPGFYYDDQGVTQPFIREPDGTFNPVNLPVEATFVQPEQINDHGQLVGFFGDVNETEHGFFLHGSVFRQIDYPGAAVTSALDINDHGSIVGQQWTTLSGPFNGYVLSKGKFAAISVPGATFTEANGINNRGKIVGSYTRGSAWHGFLLRNGRIVSFDFPGASFTRPFSINDYDQIVGYYLDSNNVYHGFLAEPASR
jgi:hypothetical protein